MASRTSLLQIVGVIVALLLLSVVALPGWEVVYLVLAPVRGLLLMELGVALLYWALLERGIVQVPVVAEEPIEPWLEREAGA